MSAATEMALLERVAGELAAGDGVRLWLVRLDDDATHQELLALLSSDERERAASYPGTTRGRRFIRGRGALRAVLGRVAGLSPADLRFAYGRDGKPSLLEGSARLGRDLQFNVSHARDLALIVVAQGRRVGVDVAWVHGETRLAPVVDRFFSPAERSAYEAADEQQRRSVFTRIWVRKEAYLKARGEGISERIYDTDMCDGGLAARPSNAVAPAPSASTESDRRDQDHWLVRDIADIPEGYLASVALERRST